MKTYLSFFKMRFVNGLQYRTAAYAGVATQFAWGFMNIMMFSAFYRSNPNAFPMEFESLSSYIWLQQAFLALFMAWFFDGEIFDSITSGNVAYEICRPIAIYDMWFIKCLATRYARVALRFAPVLIISAFLPSPIGLSAPPNLWAFLGFIISTFLGCLVVVSFNMIVYISAFFTISPIGIRILSISVVEFFAGAIIPLPFLPDKIRFVFELLPFASMQSTPFLIYTGHISGMSAISAIGLQIFWTVVLLACGKLMIKNALKKVVVQGG